MAGFGQTPLGTSPFGLGTPLALPPETTGTWGIRWLNPITRNFEIDPATNQYKQMPEMRQRVYLALAETFGSSTVRPKDGLKLPDKMGDGFERLMEAQVRMALDYLVNVERAIDIDLILVEKVNSQRAHTIVQWTDRTTGETDSLTLQN